MNIYGNVRNFNLDIYGNVYELHGNGGLVCYISLNINTKFEIILIR